MSQIELLIDEALLSGLDDWQSDLQLAGVVVSTLGIRDAQRTRDVCLSLIAELLGSGLIVGGSVDRDHGFQYWGLEAAEAFEAVRRRWPTDVRIQPGDAGWFDLTDAGRERAEGLQAKLDSLGLKGSCHALWFAAHDQYRMMTIIDALDAYRGVHGGYPADLRSLVPEGLGAIPLSYVDRPFRYEGGGSRFLLSPPYQHGESFDSEAGWSVSSS